MMQYIDTGDVFAGNSDVIPNGYEVRYLCQGRRDGGGTYRNRLGCLVYNPNIMRIGIMHHDAICRRVVKKGFKGRLGSHTKTA